MDSFYGAHAGQGFTISDRFNSVADMVAAFKQGPDYTRCFFNGYVLIACKNINSEENGRLYQRGLDYTNDMGGAIFVGRIVGPRSGTPFFNMNTVQEVKNISTMTLGEDDVRVYPTGYDTDDEGRVIGYTYNTDANEPIATFPISTAHDTSLVPGKTEEGDFNDELIMTWVNIRTNDSDKSSYFYVGLTIPYLVEEYETHMVSPYDTSGNIEENPTTATRVDDGEHPFYQMWDFGIPKGVKGDALRNLRVITPTAGMTIYDPSAITVNPQTGGISLGAAGYTGQQDDITDGRKILVYDLYWYDNQLNPDPVMVYLGDFNKIDEITLADDGTLTIDYSHDDNTVFSRKIKWITDAVLSPDSGVFTITYNNGDPAFSTTLDWIKSIVLDDDGTIHFWHTANNRDESYSNRLKWVTAVDLNTANGTFTMNFNYGDPLVRVLDYVDDVVIDDTTGDITIHKVNSGNHLSDSKLKLIESATASTDGVVTFHTNTGESFNIVQQGGSGNFQLRTIENVRLNTRLADDKHIQIKYNTSANYTNIGDPINYISDMVVRDSDFHLLVLYTDPEHRSNGSGLDGSGADSNGNVWVNNVVGSDGVNTGASIYWQDMGTIKDQSGVLIGMNITDAMLGGQDILQYLNTNYPNGFTEGNTKQKIATYGDADNKRFYAFDYNTYSWYYLGTLGDSGERDVKLVTQGSFSDDDIANVSTNGLVFKIINSSNLKTDAIPDYWSADYNTWV